MERQGKIMEDNKKRDKTMGGVCVAVGVSLFLFGAYI